MCILEYIDVLRDASGIGIVGPHFDLEVDNIEHDDAFTALLEVIDEPFGFDNGVVGVSVFELV